MLMRNYGYLPKEMKVCKQHCIQIHFKRHNTIRQQLMVPKDKNNKLKKCGVIFLYRCSPLECKEQYTGEIVRTLGDRVKEHMKVPSPKHLHTSTTGHRISTDNFIIIDKGTQSTTRNIREAK